jgi:hypothetical protein
LLKTIFFNLYALGFNFSFYLFLTIILVSTTLLFTSLRKKFIYYILAVILFAVWGFLLDLDGMMLVLLTTEFTIILLFLMTYTQLYSNYTFIKFSVSYKYLLIFFVILLFVYEPLNNFYFYSCYYKSISHIVSSDFYILYYFLFEKLPLLVILMTLIISFFSLFFIIAYYSMKLVKLDSHKHLKNLYFLRKQNLAKQTSFTTKVYTFQN